MCHPARKPKTAAPVAFLIAIRQADETDRIYAILAESGGEGVRLAPAQEPEGRAPCHGVILGPLAVKRIKLKPREAPII